MKLSSLTTDEQNKLIEDYTSNEPTQFDEMFKKLLLKEALNAMIELREDVNLGNHEQYRGMCAAYQDFMAESTIQVLKYHGLKIPFGYSEVREVIEGFHERVIEQIFASWPSYSGSLAFPVPAPNKDDNAREYYLSSVGGFWTDEYGQSRRDLLNFTIEELSKTVKNEK
ncbi:hypothetical protein KNT64_gp193 [Pseudomonas phage PspYZU05]|uniref:Uncharacterized protein n=1 Tax=Pseudomonas phage PspYZU05 TaxID=1983556 RepID=A0A2U7N2S8_9CAUD|nr:hypothetical protein KNT64_gp193 [Pseudomonas phage PspYZU05]ASD52145.1 hypothetical protein PspYZU05_193 [Pseudomonas phage PspYZU05]